MTDNQEGKPMLETEAIELLHQYNISYPEHGFAKNEADAAMIAEKIGFPVVLKVVSPQILHKSDAGGVKVNLKEPCEVIAAYKELSQSVNKYDPDAVILGVLVCKQAEPGQEVIIGALNDEIFGPTIMFGLGGVFIEVLKDVSFRVCPLDQSEAEKLINEIKGSKILNGTRGQSRLDVDALNELIVQTSNILMDHPEIKELDFNPVRIYETGVKILDARIILKNQSSGSS